MPDIIKKSPEIIKKSPEIIKKSPDIIINPHESQHIPMSLHDSPHVSSASSSSFCQFFSLSQYTEVCTRIRKAMSKSEIVEPGSELSTCFWSTKTAPEHESLNFRNSMEFNLNVLRNLEIAPFQRLFFFRERTQPSTTA